MNASLALVWALWTVYGSGYGIQPVVAGYFSTEAGCTRTLERLNKLALTRWDKTPVMQCIQAEYVIGVIQK